MTYRVWAECISDVYVDIEADSEEEAREAAEALDGGEFMEIPETGGWELQRPILIGSK